MQLYEYYRSSAAYRVRIALNLKGIAYESVPVNLLTGEQLNEAYATINRSSLVPTLITDNGTTLAQSSAICEYLEECYPTPPLLPQDPVQRAQVRSLMQIVACDVHPIANLRVQKYLRGPLQQADSAVSAWVQHWISLGFDAFEAELQTGSRYCHGGQLSYADVFVVPQHYNAVRFGVDLTPYPKLCAVVAACSELDAFVRAHPSQQPDAPAT